MAADHVELPFAEMVVHESLRLYPPNWVLIIRRCIQDSTIGGYRIPRGSWLYIFPYVIHRDARWFTAPESFDPDRFAPENFGPAAEGLPTFRSVWGRMFVLGKPFRRSSSHPSWLASCRNSDSNFRPIRRTWNPN